MDRDRLDRLTGNYRQSEDGVLEATGDGTFTVRSWGREHTWEGLGATWPDADNQPGEVTRVAFLQHSPLLPLYFSRGSKPGSRFVPDRIGELVWRFRASWQCALGAEKSARIPGESLDLTEICEASYQYWEVVVKTPGGRYIAVGPKSTNYNANSYLMAWDFFTGEELWEEAVEVYDGFPQVEYIPSLNAVFVSGYWIYYDGEDYFYTEAPRIYDLDTGALIFGRDFEGGEDPDWPSPAVSLNMSGGGGSVVINDQRQWKWFIDQAAQMTRYILPYSDELAAQALFHERIVGLAGYQLGYDNGTFQQLSGAITYEGTPGSAGVLAENTDILYNWNYEQYEACDFNARPVKAWVGFGYRRLGVGLEWNAPQRYPTNPKRRAIQSTTTGQYGTYYNPEYRYNPTPTVYKQIEIDRIGLKIQATNSEGEVVEWERTWDINDHTQIIIDDDPKDLATLESEWKERVKAEARAYYTINGGVAEPPAPKNPNLWDLDIDNLSLINDPHNLSIQSDLTDGIPGEHTGGGWGVASSGVGINLKFSARSSIVNDHIGNFSPNYNCLTNEGIPSYATGVYGTSGTNNRQANLYSSRVVSTRTNGDRIVINYTTPSNNDLIGTHYYTFRRWRGTKTGVAEDLGYRDLSRSSDYTFMVDDPSELPQYPDDAPFQDETPPFSSSLQSWIVQGDCNGYRAIELELNGVPNIVSYQSYHFFRSVNFLDNAEWYKQAFVTSEDTATTMVLVTTFAGGPIEDAGYTSVNDNQYFDPFTRTWETDEPAGGGVSPNRLEVCKDFDYQVARGYSFLPRGGKSAITVLREVDENLVEQFTLEFGGDYNKFNSHGTSQYPYTNGTPGVNGLWVDRYQFDDPDAWDEGDHVTKVERYDWDGELVYSHDVPGNPWDWIIICGRDVASGEDFLLIQNLDTWDLHLYDEEGFVRTYDTMTDRFYNGSFWIVDNEIYYTQYGAESEVEDYPFQYTFANKVIKL